MTQLALKHLHFSGELKGSEVAARLGVNFSVVEPALEFLKGQHQVEVAGGAITGAASYRYRITDAGRTRVALFLQTNQYVGVAPVPYEQYRRYMQRLRGVGAADARRASGCARRCRTWSSASRCSTSWARRSTPATRCSSTGRPATARR